jgi:hypothetical protein
MTSHIWEDFQYHIWGDFPQHEWISGPFVWLPIYGKTSNIL